MALLKSPCLRAATAPARVAEVTLLEGCHSTCEGRLTGASSLNEGRGRECNLLHRVDAGTLGLGGCDVSDTSELSLDLLELLVADDLGLHQLLNVAE